MIPRNSLMKSSLLTYLFKLPVRKVFLHFRFCEHTSRNYIPHGIQNPMITMQTEVLINGLLIKKYSKLSS